MTTGNNPAEFRGAAHYATENLEARILSAFGASGKPRISITLDDLCAVDEFHISGRQATEAIAAQMNLSAGMHLRMWHWRPGALLRLRARLPGHRY